MSFTIAVPTHDRRETALLAVRSVLAQTRQPAAVIVLCDGCSDGTAEAVRALGDPRVTALELPKGVGYGYEHRNRALELAATEAIVFLADDDLLLPDHLERIGALWDAGEVDLVQNGAALIEPDDALTWLGSDWSVPELRAELERCNQVPMSSVCVRVELARAAGGWDGAVARGADWDLWRRVLAAGARSAMSDVPTHLHFRATGRVQPWPERVRQNEAWLARIADPASLARLRQRLARLRSEHDGRLAAERARLLAHLADAERQVADAVRQIASAQERIDTLAAERDAALGR